jgi:hypothetical protein
MVTSKISETTIETFAIELLEKLGYQYVYAPDIAPDSETPERERFEGKTRDTPHFSLVAALRSLVLYKYWGVSLVFIPFRLGSDDSAWLLW